MPNYRPRWYRYINLSLPKALPNHKSILQYGTLIQYQYWYRGTVYLYTYMYRYTGSYVQLYMYRYRSTGIAACTVPVHRYMRTQTPTKRVYLLDPNEVYNLALDGTVSVSLAR